MRKSQSFLRSAPVTCGCLIICLAFFLVTGGLQAPTAARLDALDEWGAVIDRPYTQRLDADTVLIDRELRAPIALWQGELWRIPVCAFHHVDLWHLLINFVSAVYLGRLCERFYGSRNLLRLLPAIVAIPMIPEFLRGHYVLGFSGVIAAMFGLLCVLRQKNEELAEEFPDEAVYLGGVLLAAGVIFSALEMAPIANLAHMTGFVLGALAGCVATGLPWGVRIARSTQLGFYAVAVAALWFVIHPTWDGAYHWYLAKQATDDGRKLAELQQAVTLDPHLVGAFRALADLQAQQGDDHAAWKTMLTALNANPSDSSLMRRVQREWQELTAGPQRDAARQTVREVFGDLAEIWTAQLDAIPPDELLSEQLRRLIVVEVDPVVAFPLDRAIDLRLPNLPENGPFPLEQRRIPPEGDAVEGRRM